MKGAGKFREKPSGSSGKYGAGRNSGRKNFMDAEGDFFDSRSHFNWELVKQRIDMALHTITPQPRMYCIDTGSNTFIVNHLILKFRNLRKLKNVITVGTATPSGTLVVKQIFDVGQVVAVRFCPEASASLLPSDIIND